MNRSLQITRSTRLNPTFPVLPLHSSGIVNEEMRRIEQAILKTSAYADIFDYPLTAEEIHFYLIGVKATTETVAFILHNSQAIKEFMAQSEGFFTLKGREEVLQVRRSRLRVAERLLPKAAGYGAWIARFPYVRMVALTGALAVGNVEEGADIDFLIVTENGHVWTCRAAILLLVRFAALRGDKICPNYYLSERSLSFTQPDLYTAHEIAQMIPIAGIETYWRMRQLNPWTLHFLPNATGPNHFPISPLQVSQAGKANAPFENLLRLPLFKMVERWEMERKMRKFQRKYAPSQGKSFDEAAFSQDWCKGHFDGHRRRTLEAYLERISRFDGE